MNQPTVLIVSDDSQFSGDVSGRWQAERSIPAFTLVGGDLVQGLDPETFDLAIVGPVRLELLPRVLKALEASGKPIAFVCEDGERARVAKSSRGMVIRHNEDWLDTLVQVVSEVLKRCDATERLHRAEQANAILELQATLGRYMLEMRHGLNNALTSVLGNAELLCLDAGSLSPQIHSQLETIRSMALRMHEILQRFSSLEKELNVAARQAERETQRKTAGAGS